jgi:hypothetical protein
MRGFFVNSVFLNDEHNQEERRLALGIARNTLPHASYFPFVAAAFQLFRPPSRGIHDRALGPRRKSWGDGRRRPASGPGKAEERFHSLGCLNARSYPKNCDDVTSDSNHEQDKNVAGRTQVSRRSRERRRSLTTTTAPRFPQHFFRRAGLFAAEGT